MDSSATESEDYSDEEKSEYLEGMSEEQRVFHRFVFCCVVLIVELKSPLF